MIFLDFSSLVLMERDKESKMLVKELGSYEVSEGAEYISKMYCEDDIVYIYFDTKRDVEEWEYSAIYDLFNEEAFENLGYNLEFMDEEYNPTWKFSFKFIEDYIEMKDKLNEICILIEAEMNSVFENISGKENEYI
jgi:hypothetical protein